MENLHVLKVEKEKRPSIIGTNISYVYGSYPNKIRALNNCSFDFYPGEIAVLTGPSCSGKSTLLSIIGAQRPIKEGSLLVLNHNISKLSSQGLQNLRKSIGYIFPEPKLLQSLNSFENLQIAMQLFPYSKEELTKYPTSMLSLFDLNELSQEKLSIHSPEQLQCIAILRALINNPKLIVADDPTAKLSQLRKENTLEIFKQKTENQNTTVIIASNDPLVIKTADRVYKLEEGTIATQVKHHKERENTEFENQKAVENASEDIFIDQE